MAILEVLKFPDPRLRIKAKPVTEVDDKIRSIVDDMFDTMYDSRGIGLAAVQVNIPLRIIVIDVSTERDTPQVLINPSYEVLDEDLQEFEEGCLSVPGFFESIKRPRKILVKALDQIGEPFEMTATGVDAVCIQHELDHLEGKLFVDFLSSMKRNGIRKKLQKQQRLRA